MIVCVRSELCSAISADTHAFLESARLEVIQLLQGMAEKGKKEKHEEQVSCSLFVFFVHSWSRASVQRGYDLLLAVH